jgi:hypothetical protein
MSNLSRTEVTDLIEGVIKAHVPVRQAFTRSAFLAELAAKSQTSRDYIVVANEFLEQLDSPRFETNDVGEFRRLY